ncbi:radical SAM family heme chaperone HemW [Halalkalibacter akibai]|uniref:Heme chaperone HemW n=1 Tax=Halalkalibacter akibai (strain ATCC 43226 / DSM 21942 / CIP 109018 / JCM 9157 / 1139) TaxID=1236973 RepID=W4QN65_HALA3|nr:radical SAM family heme chaperone HemW [Halalkalibacter akibai]GAE33352.1 coproporphyrinogen III oxidase [Halalkalibacter akibai JCM 9157]
MVRAAYIHIPFCEHICHYCDFNKVFLKNQPVDQYINSLLLEIDRMMQLRSNSALKTIYIGGGTPTALTAEQLDVLLKGIKSIIDIGKLDEYTIEVNPDSIEEDKLLVLKTHGINRLSMGVQTFDEGLLKEIGRTHSARSIKDAVKRSREAGFTNISLDLMFGLPGQSPSDFKKSLLEAIQLDVDHISAYSLKVEEKTVFYNRQRKGKLTLPPEEDEIKMYEILRDDLKQAGFKQYEISNFAKPGFESKHNLVYWNNEEYFGFGAGSHGYVDGVRYQNHGPIPKYLKAIEEGAKPVLQEHVVSEIERIEEAMFMGLRKREGVNRKQFEKLYNRSLEEAFSEQIDMLVKRGLLCSTKDSIYLTEEGLLLSNEVFEQFIAVLSE